MSFLELSFKSVVTLIVVLICFGFLRWMWTNQIDPKETIKRFGRKKAQETLDMFATRNQNAIYQDGVIVGRVSGDVNEANGKIIFQEIFDTSNLNQDSPFEYRRYKLSIVSISSSTVLDIKKDDYKSTVKHNVLRGVVCEKVK